MEYKPIGLSYNYWELPDYHTAKDPQLSGHFVVYIYTVSGKNGPPKHVEITL